jgi:3-methyl-2-oxobutanoate hydroxymethyltransferase
MLYPNDIISLKNKRKISVLTSYDYSMAGILSSTPVDIILVGDSLGNVMLGYRDTIPVTVDEIIHHAKAVVRGAGDKFIVADMPFMSVGCGKARAIKNVKRVFQETGVHAVKIEGVKPVKEIIGELNYAGVPVMGHLGLTPQRYITLGGYKKQGTVEDSAKRIYDEAVALAESGVFAIVLECVPDELALRITRDIRVPTIGIGSGSNTDGQVLVINDMLGLTVNKIPSFVKKRLNLGEDIKKAVAGFIEDMKGQEG